MLLVFCSSTVLSSFSFIFYCEPDADNNNKSKNDDDNKTPSTFKSFLVSWTPTKLSTRSHVFPLPIDPSTSPLAYSSPPLPSPSPPLELISIRSLCQSSNIHSLQMTWPSWNIPFILSDIFTSAQHKDAVDPHLAVYLSCSMTLFSGYCVSLEGFFSSANFPDKLLVWSGLLWSLWMLGRGGKGKVRMKGKLFISLLDWKSFGNMFRKVDR